MTPKLSLTGDLVVDNLLAALALVVLALVAHALLVRVVARLVRHRPVAAAGLGHARAPTRWIAVFAALAFLLQAAPPELPLRDALRQGVGLALTAAITWLGYCVVLAFADVITRLHPAQTADNLRDRRIQTQARVLARVLKTFVLLIGVAVGLMTFPEVRQLGATLLASAGVAGLVVGLAARPMLSNAIAGIQIAIAQPIRIDDEVLVKDEFGRVEEITGSYVVVKVWDERRLIVPLNWFIENPFQNWSRTSTQILGTFNMWADYRLPVAAVRARFLELVKADPAWDGRVANLIVEDTSERALKLRGLVSARSSGENFDLRARLREQLVSYIQERHAAHLPKVRLEGEPA